MDSNEINGLIEELAGDETLATLCKFVVRFERAEIDKALPHYKAKFKSMLEDLYPDAAVAGGADEAS